MDEKTKAKKKTGRYTIWAEYEDGEIFAAKETHSGKAIDGITQIQRLADRGGYDKQIVDIWARVK